MGCLLERLKEPVIQSISSGPWFRHGCTLAFCPPNPKRSRVFARDENSASQKLQDMVLNPLHKDWESAVVGVVGAIGMASWEIVSAMLALGATHVPTRFAEARVHSAIVSRDVGPEGQTGHPCRSFHNSIITTGLWTFPNNSALHLSLIPLSLLPNPTMKRNRSISSDPVSASRKRAKG